MNDLNSASKNYSDIKTELNSLPLPIGWSEHDIPRTPRAGLESAVGWILTAIAASLGAPFWFDLLNKVMVIRSTVKPHQKSREEASEDKQTDGQQTPGIAPSSSEAVTARARPADQAPAES